MQPKQYQYVSSDYVIEPNIAMSLHATTYAFLDTRPSCLRVTWEVFGYMQIHPKQGNMAALCATYLSKYTVKNTSDDQ